MINTRIGIIIGKIAIFISIIKSFIAMKYINNFLVCNAQILGILSPKSKILIIDYYLINTLPIPMEVFK